MFGCKARRTRLIGQAREIRYLGYQCLGPRPFSLGRCGDHDGAAPGGFSARCTCGWSGWESLESCTSTHRGGPGSSVSVCGELT
jgi:hypothetical protein